VLGLALRAGDVLEQRLAVLCPESRQERLDLLVRDEAGDEVDVVRRGAPDRYAF
jgi:hypothetical protein